MQTEPLVERMRGFGTTIFSEMSALATELGAINLGQGFPDTDGPPAVLDRAVQAIREGANQYPPGPGMPELRQAISAHQQQYYGLTYDPETEVLVTVGATEAICSALLGLCEPGDEVVVVEPWYDCYAAGVALAGGVRKVVPLRPDPGSGRFALDPEELRAAVTSRTRAVIVNSPHNPTGAVLTREELAAIAALCVERDVIAITDEVYEHLTFDGVEHVPLATFEGMRERTVTISSGGKTFSTTGWKVGWICAAPPLLRAARTVKQFLTYVAGGPWQLAIAHGLEHEMAWVAHLRDSLQSRRDRLVAGLATTGWNVLRPAGTYFVQADVGSDGLETCRRLAHEAGVVAIPTAVFADDVATWSPYVRFAFCKREEVLDEAIRRLSDWAVTIPPR